MRIEFQNKEYELQCSKMEVKWDRIFEWKNENGKKSQTVVNMLDDNY